jgi:phosphoribosylaminoimidazolecarboxamide formyltransferase/IMP cyclohydrolase
MEVLLKYGLNPHQKNARLTYDGEGEPLKVLNGTAGFINLLDAFGAWQIAKELKEATGKPGAASFKHVSPAGAAIAKPLDEGVRRSQMIPAAEELSPVACAYARARGGDRMCSFGDFAAVSEPVDASLARLISREVSDGIIAPGYDADALEILKSKKGGKFLALEIDPAYAPPAVDRREVYGFAMQQDNNTAKVDPKNLGTVVGALKDVPDEVAETLAVATIALKYTQSNSVCLAYDGQVIGMGAGQQSRVHCTRLCCGKADKWFLQQHPRVLDLKFREKLGRVEKTNAVDQFLLWDELADAEVEQMRSAFTEAPAPLSKEERTEWIATFKGVALSSDAFIPFRDTLDRASRSNVRFVLQAGGSLRDDLVTEAADQYGMVMIHSGMRWFTH